MGRGSEILKIAAAIDGNARDCRHESLEFFVAADEIGFGIDFDHAGGALGGGNADQTFSGNTAQFLGRGSKPLGAKPVGGSLEVAAGLGQSLLAVHHACAGALAQFLYEGSGYLRHFSP